MTAIAIRNSHRSIRHYADAAGFLARHSNTNITCKDDKHSLSTMCTTTKAGLPHFAKGKIIKGFGRGSKELGIPTANFPEEVVSDLPETIETGVYFGYANVDKGPIYKMVMSIGWNPFYGNTKKSMETHIMHKFDGDLYDQELRVAILGYIRGEKNFPNLEALIEAINNDIKTADKELDKPEYVAYKNNKFFTDP